MLQYVGSLEGRWSDWIMFLVPWGSVVCQASRLPRGPRRKSAGKNAMLREPYVDPSKMTAMLDCWINHFEGKIYSIFLRKQETSSEIFSRSWGKFDLPSKMIWLVVQQIPNPKKAQKIRRNSNKNLPNKKSTHLQQTKIFSATKKNSLTPLKKKNWVYLSFLTVYHPFFTSLF